MKKAMNAVVMAVAVAAAACSSTAPAKSQPAVSDDARAERGKYLVSMIGCNDCHTPLKMGDRKSVV